MKPKNATEQPQELWSKIFDAGTATEILEKAMRHTAHTLTGMLNCFIEVQNFSLETYSVGYIMGYTNNLEAETIGIYLHTGHNLPGQAVLIISMDDAKYLVDLLLELESGTTMFLGDLEYSALAETGNLTLSSFLNTIVKVTGDILHPSIPVTKTDMLATILEAAIAPIAMITDEIFVIECDFVNVDSGLTIRFWVLPDPTILTPTKINKGIL